MTRARASSTGSAIWSSAAIISRGRSAHLAGRGVAREVLGLRDEETCPCARLDAVEDGQHVARREGEQLRGAVGRPEEGVRAPGRLDSSSQIERERFVESGTSQVGGSFGLAGQAGGVGRLEQERRVVGASHLGGVHHRVPPHERAFVCVEGRLEGIRRVRLPCGGDQPPECEARVLGGIPVVCELGDPVDSDGAFTVVPERLGDRSVKLDPVVGEEIVEHGLT